MFRFAIACAMALFLAGDALQQAAALPSAAKKERDKTLTRKNGEFSISADEKVVVAAINRFRESQKVRKLTVDNRLLQFARANAQADAQGKPCPRVKVQGYSGTFRLAMPAPQGTNPLQMVDAILKQKIFRNQVADADAKGIGVGLAPDQNGNIRYVMIFGID